MVMASASSISLPVAVRLPCTCAPCSSASWCSWRAFSRASCSSRTARSLQAQALLGRLDPGHGPGLLGHQRRAVPEQRLDLQLQLGQARHGLFPAFPGLLHVALDARALRLQVEGAALQLLQVALQGVALGPGRGAHPGGLHQDPALLLQRPLGLLAPGLQGLDGLGEPGFLRAAFGHFQGPEPALERGDLALQQFPLGVGPLLGLADLRSCAATEARAPFRSCRARRAARWSSSISLKREAASPMRDSRDFTSASRASTRSSWRSRARRGPPPARRAA